MDVCSRANDNTGYARFQRIPWLTIPYLIPEYVLNVIRRGFGSLKNYMGAHGENRRREARTDIWRVRQDGLDNYYTLDVYGEYRNMPIALNYLRTSKTSPTRNILRY